MAGFISKETIELVNSTTDIISLVGDYTKLERRTGNDWWGCCPFHNEKSASFHVDGDKKFYYCFGCHASGNAISFVMEMEKVDFSNAVESLAKKGGIQIKYENGYKPEERKVDNTADQYIELYDRVASSFHYILTQTEQGKDALKYITERGLTKETIEKFKLGYSPADRKWLKNFLKQKNFTDEFLNNSGLFSKNYKDIAFFSDRLMFPIYNRKGQTVAFGGRIIHPQGPEDRKYLNSGDLIQYKKRETLYAFNFAKKAIRENKKVIFCEGYMDCIAYHQCGIEYAVAPLGTALTEEQVNMVRGFADTVLLSFDSDSAGKNATYKAILMCRKNNLTVKVIRLKGGKDPAEIMLKYGKENLTSQVNGAILDSDYLLNILSEVYQTDTPEGKTKAALAFFPYIDSLQTDIQKESCLDQLSQAFNLKPEAVKRDFLNRNQARERISSRQNQNQTEKSKQINLNAELRGLIAVITDMDKFSILRSSLNESDFSNPDAKQLFTILEECFSRKTFSFPDILAACNDSSLVEIITSAISSGVYQNIDIEIVAKDTIKFVKRTQIDKRKNEILKELRECDLGTEEGKLKLNALLKEKLELDKQVQTL